MTPKAISVLRVAALLALSFVGICLLFGIELDSDLAMWQRHSLADKALAIASFYGVFKLYVRWKDSDSLIMAYDKWANIDEQEDSTSQKSNQ